MVEKRNLAIYIHWPFCLSKCPYCDFNSHVSENIDHKQWSQSLIDELAYYLEKIDCAAITSVFFGGGTPSLMETKTVESLLTFMQLDQDVEVTLEANPTSIELGKLKDFKTAGVNRLSMGIQSLDDQALKFLGRQHSASDALKALEKVSSTFDRYSFDLIYARPDQTLNQWQTELDEALQFARSHLSLYQLTIEKGTPFYHAYLKGDFVMPDEDLSADFYDLTEQMVKEKGFSSYEVSNYALPGHACRHNLAYWQYQDYIGVGPGAHGRITVDGKKYATRQHRAPQIWLDRVKAESHATQTFEALSVQSQIEEFLMMGLRLKEGVSKASFREISGGHCFSELLDVNKIKLIDGFYIEDEASFRLTDQGRNCLNKVVEHLLT